MLGSPQMRRRDAQSPNRRRLRVLAALAAPAVLFAAPARAYESEIDATVDLQFYELESPYGQPQIRRRRYTDTLGMALYDLQGESRPNGPSLTFRSRLRVDSDLGQDPAERDPRSSRYVPGLEQAPFDLMYAYLDGARYLGGVFGFRVGRQYVTDVLGWWSFDGGLLAVDTPLHLRLETYGGFEQRSGLPLLTTPRYQPDGVARGSRDDLRDDQWSSYLEQAKLAPAFGVALESIGLDWLHARATYRRVINQDTVVVSPFADENGELRTIAASRVSTEKFGMTARVQNSALGALFGSLVYDLYAGVLSDASAGAEWYVHNRLTLGLDFERIVPTFDGDSIFNWFSRAAQTSATGRVDWNLSRRLALGASGGLKLFETLGDPETFANTGDESQITRELDPFGTLAGRYRWNDGNVAARAVAELGARGHRVGGDVTTVKTYDAGYYDSRVVLSLYDFEDALRPERYATSFAYVLGFGVSPAIDRVSVSRIGVEWEHAMNRLVGQRYRVLATVDFSVLR
jgi:hypothetical protein